MRRVFILTFILLCGPLCFAIGGESSGGGGNASTGEFQMIAIWALNTLSQRGEININQRTVDVSAMSRLVTQTKIQSTDEKLVLNGMPVSAINYPAEKRIIFNEDTWKSLDQQAKMQLCLHEYWGLAFADHQDDGFIFSSNMVQMIYAFSYDNPSQILSAQSTDEDLEGTLFRAMITKSKIKDQDVEQLIFEKITDLTEAGSIITSHIVYTVADMPVTPQWGFQNLRLGAKGFEFDLNFSLPGQMTCLYPLPSLSDEQGELQKEVIRCHASVPGALPENKSI